MKIEIDTENKTIEIKESINILEFNTWVHENIKDWGSYTIIPAYQWYYSTYPTYPIYPTYPYYGPSQTTTGMTTSGSTVTYLSNQVPHTYTNSIS